MYEVVTTYKDGKRVHLVVDEETNNIVDSFSEYKRAMKARDLLNKELKKKERKGYDNGYKV